MTEEEEKKLEAYNKFYFNGSGGLNVMNAAQ